MKQLIVHILPNGKMLLDRLLLTLKLHYFTSQYTTQTYTERENTKYQQQKVLLFPVSQFHYYHFHVFSIKQTFSSFIKTNNHKGTIPKLLLMAGLIFSPTLITIHSVLFYPYKVVNGKKAALQIYFPQQTLKSIQSALSSGVVSSVNNKRTECGGQTRCAHV